MNKIYLFGDSIGQGLYMDESGKYRLSRRGCVRLLKKSGLPIENYARHGFTVREGLERFLNLSAETDSLCVIEFSGNDCTPDWDAVSADPYAFHDGRVPLEEFEEKLSQFVNTARERALKPVLVTPPPLISNRYLRCILEGRSEENIMKYLGDDERIYRWQERYANVVKDTAYRLSCRLADVRKWMLDACDYDALMSPDGIHLNEEGQEYLAGRFADMCGITLKTG